MSLVYVVRTKGTVI